MLNDIDHGSRNELGSNEELSFDIGKLSPHHSSKSVVCFSLMYNAVNNGLFVLVHQLICSAQAFMNLQIS